MSVDDRGAHQPIEDEDPAGRGIVRRIHGGGSAGRHRRGRASAADAPPLQAEAALAEAESEPLFSVEPGFDPLDPIYDPIADPIAEPFVDLAEQERAAQREHAVQVEREALAATWDRPPVTERAVAPPAEPEAGAPATQVPADPIEAAMRPGRVGSFRRWWRQESLARQAQKRAFATAEAIMRAQAVEQASTGQLEKAPTPESYTQAVRGVMSLTEERFQALGIRSDRIEDELRGISRALADLHGILGGGELEGVGAAATSALGALETRVDSLLVALTEEFRRRAAETDRRLAEQLTIQSAELAALLESAVQRIRAAIPEAVSELRAALPEGFEAVKAAIPGEIDRVRAVIPEEMERLRELQHKQLDQILNVSARQLDLVRTVSAEELEQIRAAIPEGFEEVRSLLPVELEKIRDAIPVEMDKVREMLPEEIDRVRRANEEDFERIRAQIPDEMEKVRLTIPAEVERLKASIPEAMGRVVRVIPGQVERLTAENAEMLAALRLQISEALERIRSSNEEVLGEVSSSLNQTAAAELERFREQTDEQIDRVRWAIPAEVEQSRGAALQELEQIRAEIKDLEGLMHEVIAQVAVITSAASDEGDDAESR